MKKLILGFALPMSLFTISAFADDMTGYISDSKCAAKGAKDAHADCAVKCVKGGASPVLVSDGKVYKIANPDAVAEHVGHKVTVTGKVDGDTVTVDSVKM